MNGLDLVASGSCIEDSSSRTRILVVDDDELDFFIVRRLLEKARHSRYHLTHVENHESAVAELQTNTFDVVLLDYHLPGGSPDEIFHALDGHWDVPIIVLTGSESEQLEEKVLDAGALYFLDKNSLCQESLTLSISSALRRFCLDKIERAQQETLRRNWKNAEAANFSKSEFLYFLGDEIKTPLNAIIGFSRALEEIAVKEGMSEKFHMYSNTINDSSNHLMDLIEDLLELSQTKSEEFDPQGIRFKRFRTWIIDKQRGEPSDDTLYKDALLSKRERREARPSFPRLT